MNQVVLDFFEPAPTGRPKALSLPPIPCAPVFALAFAETPAIPTRGADINEVLRCVCQAYLVSRDDLIGKDRHKNIAEARGVAYWLLRTRTRASFPEIGDALRKDHTSAMSGVKRCETRRANETAFARFTDQLAAAVDARLKGEAVA